MRGAEPRELRLARVVHAPRGIREFREALEFLAPAVAHGVRKVAREITEELERRLRGKLLTHEQHGNAWRQEIDGNGGAYGGRPRT